MLMLEDLPGIVAGCWKVERDQTGRCASARSTPVMCVEKWRGRRTRYARAPHRWEWMFTESQPD